MHILLIRSLRCKWNAEAIWTSAHLLVDVVVFSKFRIMKSSFDSDSQCWINQHYFYSFLLFWSIYNVFDAYKFLYLVFSPGIHYCLATNIDHWYHWAWKYRAIPVLYCSSGDKIYYWAKSVNSIFLVNISTQECRTFTSVPENLLHHITFISVVRKYYFFFTLLLRIKNNRHSIG